MTGIFSVLVKSVTGGKGLDFSPECPVFQFDTIKDTEPNVSGAGKTLHDYNHRTKPYYLSLTDPSLGSKP